MLTWTLMLPCAGKSTRYKQTRPKWMMTAPDGLLAIQKAAASVSGAHVIRRVIAIRAEHDEKHQASLVIRRAFGEQIDIVRIDRDTNGPAETVAEIIQQANIRGPILIKDADSFFDPITPCNGSFIVSCDLRQNLDFARVGAKSFVVLNEQGNAVDIREKSVCSNNVSVGLYAFSEAEDFLRWYDSAKNMTQGGEIFISQVISEAFRHNEVFKSIAADNVIDVGTLEDWQGFTSRYQLILTDIDGVIFQNQSAYFEPYWGSPVAQIDENIQRLINLQQQGAQLVFVTSRPEKYREPTMHALTEAGLTVHALVMGCHHGKRVLINDFATSNPYPTALAVSIPRNTPCLSQYLP